MSSDESCPICWRDNVPLARGKCQHGYCIPCFHKLFRLSTVEPQSCEGEDSSGVNASPDPNESLSLQRPLEMENFPQNVNMTKLAGLAACPMCRLLIKMDDVRCVANGSKVWKKVTDLHKSPLIGMTFLAREGEGRKYSFHFPEADKINHDSKPYIRVSDYFSEEHMNQNRFEFEKGFYYMPLSQTFHGRVCLPDSFGCQQHHDVLLVFSPDHSWISDGVILRHNRLVSDTSTVKCEEKFPLDGSWLVQWFSSKPWGDQGVKARAEAHVTVSANVLLADSVPYQLRFDETKGVHFRWHVGGVEQVLDPSSDFRYPRTGDAQKKRPNVGDKLRWKTTDPTSPYIVWTCETVETDLPPPASTSFMFPPVRGNTTKSIVSQSIADDGISSWASGSPTFYHISDQLWGNTFCQHHCVGLASYHFCQDGSAYISYEHSRANSWPPLDDDSPIPIRCCFRNISYEPGNGSKGAVFRGSIHWLEDYGTTWINHQRWEYEMHFDPQFRIIVAGKVDCVSATGVTSNMSTFGANLIYVNAAF